MERRLPAGLRVLFLLMIILSTGWSEHDQDLKFCGFWRHGTRPLTLDLDLSPGCSNISISANQSSLSVAGRITAQCRRSEVIPLERFGLDSREETKFCLYWEPLLDQMKLEVGGRNRTLCWPSSLHGNCCTDLSPGPNTAEAAFGIFNATIKGDFITHKRRTAYSFDHGSQIMCKTLCDQQSSRSSQTNMPVEHPCARSSEVEMKEDFVGFNITSPVFKGEPAESGVSIHIPPALKKAAKKTNKVVLTFFKNNSLFQEGHTAVRVLDDVVEINVENEIIVNLPEPVRINFHHKVLAKRHSTKCVSWDTRKDPLQVNWLDDGCETLQKADDHTECLCNHLTYFAVLVQINPGPVRHLLVLTAITSLGCAVSVISCIALIIYLCRKSRRSKEQSIPIHLGLAVSLAFLNLLFFLTGVLANVWEDVCVWVGAGLHYSLLSSFTWMGIEVFHTFWLVYMVFTPSPKAYIWNLIGFVLPAVPIVILAAVGDIYGLREIEPSDDVSGPYPHKMCWMKETYKADLAYYFTNLTVQVVLVVSGGVMLVLVYRQIRSRDEWRQNRVAFLSIWGLSCLFGTSWGLTFLDFGPLSDFVLFLFCILNSFQGFFLMLRFCMLDWMRKQAGGSGLGSSSTGSTRQHMLQAQEKS